MSDSIFLDVWLYGDLAKYGGDANEGSHAHLPMHMPIGTTVSQLLAHLSLPTEERGITFINGDLSAMPGMQSDLNHALQDNDRVAFFHLRSMWPFQYRLGAAMINELETDMSKSKDSGLHHTYREQAE